MKKSYRYQSREEEVIRRTDRRTFAANRSQNSKRRCTAEAERR